jgi:hypothetical protein
MSIKIFNGLPKCVADSVKDKKHFVQSLRNLLINQSFYSVDEFTTIFVILTQKLSYGA